MFGHDAKPSRIYAYKVKSVASGEPLVEDQVRLAHRYRNELIAIERSRRDAVEVALAEHAPGLAGLKTAHEAAMARVAGLESALKARSQEARKKATPTAAERRELAEARRARAEAKRVHKEARAAAFADPALAAALKSRDEVDLAARKAARAACGLYWCTYLLIEQSLAKVRQGAPPEFRKWPGGRLARRISEAAGAAFDDTLASLADADRAPEGAIAVQLQNGLSWDAAALGDDRRLRLEVVPGRPLAAAWIRAGTTADGRSPVWCRAVFHLHRVPPPGSEIKWVRLHRLVVGRSIRWSLQFVVSRDSWDRPDAAANGVVGVDINWRSFPDGLRVATAIGDDGAVQSLRIPREWLAMWTKADSLRSIRDREFDAARIRLAAWIRDAEDLPPWFEAVTAHLAKWKSCNRLASVVWCWKDRRFPGDGAIYDAMEAWRKHERHLKDWEESQRIKAVRRRDDLYRKFAAGLRRRYRVAVIEDIDWKAIGMRKPPDRDDPIAPRVYKQVAAPGRLAALIRESLTDTVSAPPEYTTMRCHLCGTVNAFDMAKVVVHACEGCLAAVDIDERAAWNLLGVVHQAGPA